MEEWRKERDQKKKKYNADFWNQDIETILQNQDKIRNLFPPLDLYRDTLQKLIDKLSGQKKLLKKLSVKEAEVIVCGDTHGFIGGTCTVLEKFVKKIKSNPDTTLIFLGDYVDRGDTQIQNVFLIVKACLNYPNIYLIRGNHDFKVVNKMYGFIDEIKKTYYSKELWNLTNTLFNQLFTAITINNTIFCIHAGIPVNPPLMYLTLDQLFNAFSKGRINEFTRNMIEEPDGFDENDEENVEDWQHYQCFWNDPMNTEFDFHEPIFNVNEDRLNVRGPGIYRYSEKTLDQFFAAFKLTMMVRAHEAFQNGYAKLYDGKIWSVFSINQYGNQKIKGKYLLLVFDGNGKLASIEPHPIQ